MDKAISMPPGPLPASAMPPFALAKLKVWPSEASCWVLVGRGRMMTNSCQRENVPRGVSVLVCFPQRGLVTDSTLLLHYRLHISSRPAGNLEREETSYSGATQSNVVAVLGDNS
jgi:hypothetical protein